MTDGFFSFGEALLRSFKKHHGEDLTFFLTTRNLREQQIDKLHSLYSNLIVSNEHIDMKALAERTKVPVAKLEFQKQQVEKSFVKPQSVMWKQYISVEDRYRNSLQDAFNICGDCFLHLDVDSFINASLDPIFKIIEDNDVSLVFRPGQPERFRIFGCVMGFKFGLEADKFLTTWRKHIDSIPLQKKPKGYGQISCWRAYKELAKSEIEWGIIPKKYIGATFNKSVLIRQGNDGRKKSAVAKQFLERA